MISAGGWRLLPRRHRLCALDVGTTKVLALMAEVEGDRLSLVGVGQSPSRGLRRGVVVDIEETVRSIQDAARRAERMCGHRFESCYVSVGGPHMASHNSRGVVAVTGRDREITPQDVERVMEAARVIHIPSDREIVHVLPRHFAVDGNEGIRDPVGMIGSRLEVEAHIVTGSTTILQNLSRCLERAGIEVEGFVSAVVAAGEAVLLDDERELGVVVADLGGGTTELAVYQEGNVVHSAVLPVGGEYVTMDVAVVLRTSLAQAEVVKIDYGYAMASLAPHDRVFPVPGVGGQGMREVTAKELAEIIEARLREILAGVREAIKGCPLARSLPGGVVLTGGVAATRGIVELAAEELDLPARVGQPDHLGGMGDMASSPAFAAGVGLLYEAVRQRAGQVARRQGAGRLMDRVTGWLREVF